MRIGIAIGLFSLMIGCAETVDLQWHQYENRDQFISRKSECVHVLSDGWTILGPMDPDLYLYQWGWQVTVKTGTCDATYWIESLEYVICDKDGFELVRNALVIDRYRKPGLDPKNISGNVIVLLSDSSTTYQQSGTIAGSKALRAADGKFALKLGSSR
jgi:hypothetical protein